MAEDHQESFYREQLAGCLAAAEASTLPQVKSRHLTAAETWQVLLDLKEKRTANMEAMRTSSNGNGSGRRPMTIR